MKIESCSINRDMQLKFMEEPKLDACEYECPHCAEQERIGVHNRAEQLLKCHACKKTFAVSKGTPFAGAQYPLWVIALVLSLLAHGCPVPAIVAAFFIDERTVSDWRNKAGQHGQRVHDEIIGGGKVELGQVQLDELCINTQLGKVWMATAMSVFSRLFLGGAVSQQRDKTLIQRVVQQVHAAAGGLCQAVLFAVDGFAAYPNAIRKVFFTPEHTGAVGRPPHRLWPDLHIVQVVKSRAGRKLVDVTRKAIHGSLLRAEELIALSQTSLGVINTAFIERLNATFRANLPSLTRRTRRPARTIERLHAEMFWCGTVYNFCSLHSSLLATPAMAADLTDHVWSVRELLSRYGPRKQLQVGV